MYAQYNAAPSDDDGPRRISEVIRGLLDLYGDQLTTADKLETINVVTSSDAEAPQ